MDNNNNIYKDFSLGLFLEIHVCWGLIFDIKIYIFTFERELYLLG